jgi:hypothetical protein
MACLVLMALSSAPAAARSLYRLPVTTTACFDLEDARRLKDPLTEQGGPSCRRVSPRSFLLDRTVPGFSCLHISSRDCVWVPAGVLNPSNFDDGVF